MGATGQVEMGTDGIRKSVFAMSNYDNQNMLNSFLLLLSKTRDNNSSDYETVYNFF